MERGYEDAYRQFIEPFLGASGETHHPPDSVIAAVTDSVPIWLLSSGYYLRMKTSDEADSRRRRRRYRRNAVPHDADLRDQHVRVRLGGRRREVPGRAS